MAAPVSQTLEIRMTHRYFSLMEMDQAYRVTQFAKEVGLFEKLSSKALTSEQVAEALNGSERAYSRILPVLAAMGYLTYVHGYYSISEELAAMRRDSSLAWEALPEFMRCGEPWVASDKSVEDIDVFYEQFFSSVPYVAQMEGSASWVAERLGGEPASVLDIGAGGGTWGLALVRSNTVGRVTAVDLPRVLQSHFLPNAERLGLCGRVDIISGDFHEVVFPEGKFDLVIMGSSFHFLKESLAESVIKRIANALKPSGKLVVIDHFANSTSQQRVSRTMYEMRLAMRTRMAKNYSAAEITTICAGCGFRTTDQFDIPGPAFLSGLVFVAD